MTTEPTVTIDNIGGNCPVQAEGLINGVPYYFRARGQHWALHVGPDPLGPGAWVHRERYHDPEFHYEHEKDGDKFAAGWMTLPEARAFIVQAATLYAEREGK